MEYEYNRASDPSLKFRDSSDIYHIIKKCNSKKLKITYCCLQVDGKCVNTRTVDIKVKKYHPNFKFIEGTIIRNNELVEDVIIKTSTILDVQCLNGNICENLSIYDTIKYCNGLVLVTECCKMECGECVHKKYYPFLVTYMNKEERVIKGYKIKENFQPQFTTLDTSLIVDVDCITPKNMPDFPWWIVPMLLKKINQ